MKSLKEIRNFIIPLLLGGPTPANVWNTLQAHQTDIKIRNIEQCISILNNKIKNFIFNSELPDLSQEESNLVMTIIEEMQETYTEVKQDCITNLIANMMYEKKNGTFELYTYQVVLDQLNQMFDPEILLLKVIYKNKDSLWTFDISDTLLSVNKISKYDEYSAYRIKKLENLAFLKLNTGLASGGDSMGEYSYNSEYFNTFYTKACTLLYDIK